MWLGHAIEHVIVTCFFHHADALLERLAKGERIPVTSELKPLVESARSKWDMSGADSLDEQQVSAKPSTCSVKCHCSSPK